MSEVLEQGATRWANPSDYNAPDGPSPEFRSPRRANRQATRRINPSRPGYTPPRPGKTLPANRPRPTRPVPMPEPVPVPGAGPLAPGRAPIPGGGLRRGIKYIIPGLGWYYDYIALRDVYYLYRAYKIKRGRPPGWDMRGWTLEKDCGYPPTYGPSRSPLTGNPTTCGPVYQGTDAPPPNNVLPIRPQDQNAYFNHWIKHPDYEWGFYYYSQRWKRDVGSTTTPVWEEEIVDRSEEYYISRFINPHPNPNLMRYLPSIPPQAEPLPDPDPFADPQADPDGPFDVPPGSESPGKAVEITPDGVRPIPPRLRVPPQPGERETKMMSRSKRFLVGLFHVLDQMSETAEIVDALYEALPEKTKERWKCDRHEFPIDVAGQYGIDNADCKAKALWHNFHSVDNVAAMENIIKNYIEDTILGSIHKNLPGNIGSSLDDQFRGISEEIDRVLDKYVDLGWIPLR